MGTSVPMLLHKYTLIIMNKKLILIFLACTLVATDFFLFQRTQSLKSTLLSDAEQCESRLSMLQTRYANQPVSRTAAPQQIALVTTDQPNINTATPATEINLENLVSHAHRVQAVSEKYEFLLTTAQVDDADRNALRKLLTQRERLANAILLSEQRGTANSGDLRSKLREIENQIEIVLTDPLDYQRYEYLRERSL